MKAVGVSTERDRITTVLCLGLDDGKLVRFHPGMVIDATELGDLLPLSGAEYRSEEHTSELQSRLHLVCRLLLEKKNTHHQPHRAHRKPLHYFLARRSFSRRLLDPRGDPPDAALYSAASRRPLSTRSHTDPQSSH